MRKMYCTCIVQKKEMYILVLMWYTMRSFTFRRRICTSEGYSLDLYNASVIPDYEEKQSDLG